MRITVYKECNDGSDSINHILKLLHMRNIRLFIKVPLIAKVKLCYNFREYISVCELFLSV